MDVDSNTGFLTFFSRLPLQGAELLLRLIGCGTFPESDSTSSEAMKTMIINRINDFNLARKRGQILPRAFSIKPIILLIPERLSKN